MKIRRSIESLNDFPSLDTRRRGGCDWCDPNVILPCRYGAVLPDDGISEAYAFAIDIRGLNIVPDVLIGGHVEDRKSSEYRPSAVVSHRVQSSPSQPGI